MAKVDVINVEGKKVGDITLSDEIFGIEPNEFAEGNRPSQTGKLDRPITGRRRSGIRTKAKKLQILTQQEAQETRSQVGSLRKGCRQRADRSRRVQVHRA